MVLKKKIFKFYQCILVICYYLPLRKGKVFLLVKLDSPLSEDVCIMPSLVEIGPLVQEKILRFVNLFSRVRYYLPLGKGMAL